MSGPPEGANPLFVSVPWLYPFLWDGRTQDDGRNRRRSGPSVMNPLDGSGSVRGEDAGGRCPWARFSSWLECVCVVTFDLELGQAIEVPNGG